eukprot:Plantae.Rhodophyta-Purpureofilum_apyrenoidigerum.ctg13678.p1 GENE.Plantae.Rhodophyta-Purpureofilum_apyrenoidigerum.ctg13678~~Plantae.Rhodophyta-Purpureofilum_apyrenoidigerum.ctg13678.p1  ORF type:complete len:293 (-),score=39.94 Plantae.Rhodophyta-Purpureofilum_apyrenoidigerum.ctg13678:256-1134(-)
MADVDGVKRTERIDVPCLRFLDEGDLEYASSREYDVYRQRCQVAEEEEQRAFAENANGKRPNRLMRITRSFHTRRRSSSVGPKSPRAGSRRLQRFYHQAMLKSTADPDDLTDPDRLRKLFAVETPSLFGDVLQDSKYLKCLEPFLVVSEEQQENEFLRLQEEHSKKVRGKRRTSCYKADVRYKNIDRRVRELISMRTDCVLSVLEHFENDVRECAGQGITLELTDGMCRMVAHGLAQYYGMNSWSEEQESGRRLTYMKPTKATIVCEQTLFDYISQQHRGPSVCYEKASLLM